MIEGGCFCKAIRYRITEGDYTVVNCHCTMCRKTSAAPYVTWIVVPRDSIEFHGEKTKILHSSDKAEREFCCQCGTPLTFKETDRPEYVDVTVGSLDHPENYAPIKSVFEDTKLPWID